MWHSTDDDFGGTNLCGDNLYPNVLARLSQLEPTNGHPFTFYQRLGFTVLGVLPALLIPGGAYGPFLVSLDENAKAAQQDKGQES